MPNYKLFVLLAVATLAGCTAPFDRLSAMLEHEKRRPFMLRTRISILVLALSLFGVAACANPDATSKALNETIKSATENVGNAADDTAKALGDAAEDLGEFVGDAAQDVEKAIDESTRKKSDAK